MTPNADHWDKASKFPMEAWRILDKQGLTGIPIPRYGRDGQDVVSYIMAVEEISKGSPAAALMTIKQLADLKSKKEMARRLAGIST